MLWFLEVYSLTMEEENIARVFRSRRVSDNLMETMRCVPPAHRQHSRDPGERTQRKRKNIPPGGEGTVQYKPRTGGGWNRWESSGKELSTSGTQHSNRSATKQRDDWLFSRRSGKENWFTTRRKTKLDPYLSLHQGYIMLRWASH